MKFISGWTVYNVLIAVIALRRLKKPRIIPGKDDNNTLTVCVSFTQFQIELVKPTLFFNFGGRRVPTLLF